MATLFGTRFATRTEGARRPPDDAREQQASRRCCTCGRSASFNGLPAEIHLLISKHLIYPDALSLKHTSRYFYGLVDTGVALKVEWLMQRRSLHLECPNNTSCHLGSDLRFCRGSVALLMRRRREHLECESKPGLGCLVYGTTTCAHRRRPAQQAKRWLRSRLTVELWWVLLALIALALSWLWMAELLFG